MTGFDAKRNFQREMVKPLRKAVFNLKKTNQNTLFKKKLYSKSVFDAKRIFQQEVVKFSKTLLSTQN